VNVAFYAPLKPPDHSIPSGDRAMARALRRALAAGGHRVMLVSRLRSYERAGDAAAQARIARRAARTVERLLARYRRAAPAERPQAWFTYHLYHKAPDLLGPAVSRALGIPYLVAEASHAPKQAGGPWDAGYRAAADALRAASAVVVLNPADEPCVRALLGGGARLHRLAPFLDARTRVRAAARAASGAAWSALPDGGPGAAGAPVLVTVAMMRDGAKLASYRLLGEALARLRDRRWELLVIGDGPARAQVHAALAGLGARVHYAGMVPGRDLPRWLAGCDLHLWPAAGEAWGMVFLEAAAAGVPSVAGAEGGVAQVVRHGRSGLLVPPRDAQAFAAAAARLLDDRPLREAMGRRARERLLAEHDLDAAARALDRILAEAAACASCC